MMGKACTIIYIITTDWISSSQCDILKIKMHIYKNAFCFVRTSKPGPNYSVKIIVTNITVGEGSIHGVH
jgi:hypothetical protein